MAYFSTAIKLQQIKYLKWENDHLKILSKTNNQLMDAASLTRKSYLLLVNLVALKGQPPAILLKIHIV